MTQPRADVFRYVPDCLSGNRWVVVDTITSWVVASASSETEALRLAVQLSIWKGQPGGTQLPLVVGL
jgi:hypothetical protein